MPSVKKDRLRLWKAIQAVRDGDGRNLTGFSLACQLRDDGLDYGDALPLMAEYQEAVKDEGVHPYTLEEMEKTLTSVYSQPPREKAWGSTAPEARLATEDEDVAFTAADLLKKHLPCRPWVVPDLFPPGCTVIAAKGKSGKSFLMRQLATAKAAGTVFLGRQLTPGDVVYLALEDTERKIQEHLTDIVEEQHLDESTLSHLHFRVRSKRVGEGGIEDLDAFLTRHPEIRLVIVDTLIRIRPNRPSSAHMVKADYDDIRVFKELGERHNVDVVIVHHLRKEPDRDNPFNEISGTDGIIQAADNTIIMHTYDHHTRGTVQGVGRDLTDELYPITRLASGSWTAPAVTPTPKDVLTLKALGKGPADAKTLCIRIGDELNDTNINSMTQRLRRFVAAGKAQSVRRGVYGLPA